MQKTRHQIRQDVRQLRRQLSHQQQHDYSHQLKQQLTQHPKLNQAKKVALYLANDGELCPQPLIEWCWQQGIKTYLPVLDPINEGHLLFLHYHANSPMQTNKFGIAEPCLHSNQKTSIEQLDVIFTPLVAFDHFGNRLGMGGGFYDRTLASLNNIGTSPYTIGLAHDLQCLPKLPIEAWDIPLPEVITPSKIWSWGSVFKPDDTL
ncbi:MULTISPECIES: 5-formyltetrahydrofolate cyclo-ligase [unclassified Motilimonas]|uniref:5-formyltetrahydrofolate cyclo-ligase n=1 Tax=Motilimonas TaxID=1914248 RepID=UPI001E34EAB0|nr:MULTISPECIES: 5-formyltetrahydrofolate cyclo-ligase [unclassified Motilimonas]MCE0558663.1 5-formyltetrahydrofolate cyclo-ligase [Motilimonas sp. E26]MDO6525693.1 5-formyltetrahydrofolate cyclo-ligase [Motilimonas sp. 1_MG-2023]